jgi:phosphoribosylformylglycinamidine cyclo-ligase
LADALLEPTRIYVRSCLAAIRDGSVKGLAHITGGGLTENLPRILPPQLAATIDLAAIPVPLVFGWLAGAGPVSEAEMLRTFNCGVGMVVVVGAEAAERCIAVLRREGEAVAVIGQLEPRSDAAVRYAGRLDLGGG